MKHIAGDILILNRKGKNGNLLSSINRFFTGMPYTHVAIVIGKVQGIMSVISADTLVNIQPLQNFLDEEDSDIKIFRPKIKVNPKGLKVLYSKYAATPYGFLQVFWFAYRWLMEKFNKDVRRSENFLNKGTICSELVWYYLYYLSIGTNYGMNDLNEKLIEWTPNTIHAGDINLICESLPEIFELIYESKK